MIGAAEATQQASASVGDHKVIRGNAVAIPVSHSATATLTIGDANRGFEVEVPLDGGGTTTVEFNTYQTTSSNPNAFLSVGGASLTAPSSGSLDKVLSPGQYTLTVTIDGAVKDVGSLTVLPRHQTTSQMARLPSTMNIEDEQAVPTPEVYNQLTTGNDVVRGEYAALMIQNSGLGGAFGDNPTPTSITSEGIHLRVKELSPEPNTDANVATVENLLIRDQMGVKGSTDGRHNRFLVIWDTSEIEMSGFRKYTYELQVVLDGDESPLVASDETVASGRINLKQPMIQMQANPGFTLLPWNDSKIMISGQTNFAPGTELSVAALQETPHPHLWEQTVLADEDGSFSVTFQFPRIHQAGDLPGVQPDEYPAAERPSEIPGDYRAGEFPGAHRPGELPLWIQGYREWTDYSIRLPKTNAGLKLPDQTATNDTVTVTDVTLSGDGFVRLTANETTIGTSRLLASGVYDSVDISLNTTIDQPTTVRATAIKDANGNEAFDTNDSVYTAAGSPVSDTALIQQPAEPTTTTQPTTTAMPTIPVQESEPLAPVENNASSGFAPLSPITTILAAAIAVLLAVRLKE
ncbi:DUF7282 domain-containing protein [Halobacterium sp. KA-6]|uniref:DUF7282 domain-containing protein n=1 Tax=Halobacterium sp. KA-6 TaxID=2896368 RepID=UPI001E4B81BD|nr:hypothetical protein [Halobacterium sp. KA-6]MCD2205038.1 hypothetical protein [Halobacterium sp. KA-6]